jgi:parallel beta-helix repeat protein
VNAIHRRSIPRSRLFARLLRILLLLAIAMQVYWPPPAHAATTLTVTSTEDSGPGTLRDAIAAATGGDTIDFDGALSGQTITLLSPLLLNKDLTIDGSAIAAPVTLSGGGAVRILEVAEGATVWVLGLVFEDGQASEAQGEGLANQGGAIRNAGTLTLTRCTLTGNRGYQGAAIHNATAGYLTVSECTISGNHASNSGGGIWSVGTLALHGSVISGNSAEGTGGGFYSVSSQENVVTACTFEANTAMGGGAIHAGGRLTVADSTFYMNTAGIAGAIANSGTLTLTNSTLVANAATGAPILPMIGAGGLLNLQWATIRHSTFAGNSAAEGTGAV